MNIKIYSKDLKTLLEKVTPLINKKSTIPSIISVLLESKDGILSAITTDVDHYLVVQTKDYIKIEDGKLLIDYDDIDVITKLTGTLEIRTEDTEDNTYYIKNEKKLITLHGKDVTQFPELPIDETNVLCTIPKEQFIKAIGKLKFYVGDNENNPIMSCYHINLERNHIEALDGHRLGVIDITPQKNTKEKSILIHSDMNRFLKKILVHQVGELAIKAVEKYIIISDQEFTYFQKKIDGEYYKIEQMLSSDYDFSFVVKTKELEEIAKFNLELVTIQEKKPMLFFYDKEKDTLYSIMETVKQTSADKINTLDLQMQKKDFMIGLNPKFIYEALRCIDNDTVTITGTHNKAPIFMTTQNEKYLILPVNFWIDNNDDYYFTLAKNLTKEL